MPLDDVTHHEQVDASHAPGPVAPSASGQPGDTPKPVSAVAAVLSSRFQSGATIAMFLSGLATSAAAPQIARFLVGELHASLTTAGLYYLTNLTSPVAGYLIGSRSDRTGRRLGLFRACALLGALGWLVVAMSHQLWVPFVTSAVLLAIAGAAGSQLFAAVHDDLQAHPDLPADGVVSVVRMALTAGWVVGPFAGQLLAAQAGLRTMFVATALVTAAQVLPIGVQHVIGTHPAASGEPGATPHQRPTLRRMAALLAFTGLYICVYAGESTKYAYLPIYMNDRLHLAAGLSGAVIGIQPLIELALMPVAVVVARRTGMLHLMVVGAAAGVGANLCFALWHHPVGLFAGQVLMGVVWGVFAGLGIIVAQRLLPEAVATASAIFMSSVAISSALGGLAGGLGAAALGLPHVFFVPAVFGCVAVVGLAVMARGEVPDAATPDRGRA